MAQHEIIDVRSQALYQLKAGFNFLGIIEVCNICYYIIKLTKYLIDISIYNRNLRKKNGK